MTKSKKEQKTNQILQCKMLRESKPSKKKSEPKT